MPILAEPNLKNPVGLYRRHDTQHIDSQHNDTQHYDIQYNDT